MAPAPRRRGSPGRCMRPTRPVPRKKILVAIFQRGAMDGLNVVVPHGEKAYYDLRPNLAIPRPDGTPDSAIDLDGFFGLHPSLRPLKQVYDAGQLAIVHAVGSPDPTRSHFDAQDYMESGTPGTKTTGDGWLNRALAPEKTVSPVRAVSLGPELPHALRGHNEAVAIDNLNDFKVRDTRGASAFESMYAGTHDTVLNGTGREAFEAVKRVQDIEKRPYTPAANVRYPERQAGPEPDADRPSDQSQRGAGSCVHRCRRLGPPCQRGRREIHRRPARQSVDGLRPGAFGLLSGSGRSHGRRRASSV